MNCFDDTSPIIYNIISKADTQFELTKYMQACTDILAMSAQVQVASSQWCIVTCSDNILCALSYTELLIYYQYIPL